MGNLLFRGRTIEIPGTTSTERKLSPMVRCGVSPHEMEAEAARYSSNNSDVEVFQLSSKVVNCSSKLSQIRITCCFIAVEMLQMLRRRRTYCRYNR